MSKPSQISANRRNAQLSTGPKSTAGKAVSCQNSFRRGFTRAFHVLPYEDQEGYDTLLAGLNAEHKPSGVTETILVEKMAQHLWLSNNDRGFHTCLNQLLKLRAETRRAQIVFEESRKRREAGEARRAAREIRDQELYKSKLWLLQAQGEHQELKNSQIDPDPNHFPQRLKRIISRDKAA